MESLPWRCSLQSFTLTANATRLITQVTKSYGWGLNRLSIMHKQDLRLHHRFHALYVLCVWERDRQRIHRERQRGKHVHILSGLLHEETPWKVIKCTLLCIELFPGCWSIIPGCPCIPTVFIEQLLHSDVCLWKSKVNTLGEKLTIN